MQEALSFGLGNVEVPHSKLVNLGQKLASFRFALLREDWNNIAKVLLGGYALSVTDIGLSLGFNEASSFTTTFRKMTGQRAGIPDQHVPSNNCLFMQTARKTAPLRSGIAATCGERGV